MWHSLITGRSFVRHIESLQSIGLSPCPYSTAIQLPGLLSRSSGQSLLLKLIPECNKETPQVPFSHLIHQDILARPRGVGTSNCNDHVCYILQTTTLHFRDLLVSKYGEDGAPSLIFPEACQRLFCLQMALFLFE